MRLAVTMALGAVLSVATPARSAPRKDAREKVVQGLIADAIAATKAHEFLRAAALYTQAWHADPTDLGLLYGSGRALFLAGEWAAAIDRLEDFLVRQKASPDPRFALLVPTAMQTLEAARVRLAPVAPPPLAKPPPPLAKPLPLPPVSPPPAEIAAPQITRVTVLQPARPRSLAPWLVTTSGALLGLTGAVLTGFALQDRRTFDTAMAQGLSGGTVPGYDSRATAMADAQGIARRETTGVVLLVTGMTAAVTGLAWAWWRDGDETDAGARR
jgi:hypothetical protein